MTEKIQLENLVYSYVDWNNPFIREQIGLHEEFSKLSSKKEGEIIEVGKLFPHQIVIKRLMLILDRIFLFHKTGTGKTCSAASSAEHFKISAYNEILDYIDEYITNQRSYIKKVIVILKPGTENGFKRQIIDRCGTSYLESEELKGDITDKAFTRRVNTILRKFYEFYTHEIFVTEKLLDKEGNQKSDQEIINYFKNTLIIIDEIHNINPSRRKEKTQSEDESKKNRYFDLYANFFDIIYGTNAKVIAMTATPMMDKVDEIFRLLSLLLPPGQKIKDNEDLNKNKDRLYGLISYIKEANIGLDKKYIGTPLLSPNSDEIVYICNMQGLQEQVYKKFQESEDIENEKFRIKTSQICNFVYPDGSYGKIGNDKYVRVENGRYKWSDPSTKQILKIGNLENYSKKFSEIIKISDNTQGKVFCYSHYLTGSSLIELLLCFEANDYQPFYIQDYKFKNLEQDIKSLDRSVKRIALLSGSSVGRKITDTLAIYNHPLNVNGDYLKVILISPIGKESLNTNNVMAYILLNSLWIPEEKYQAESRVFRVNSHTERIEQLRIADPNARLAIDVYQMGSTLNNSISPSVTSDIDIYYRCNSKGKDIANFHKVLQGMAIDYYINYNRNRNEDIDPYVNSIVSVEVQKNFIDVINKYGFDEMIQSAINSGYNYDEIRKILRNIIINKKTLIKEAFNIMYSDEEEVENVIDYIKENLITQNILNYEDLIKIFSEHILLKAIKKIIDTKELIKTTEGEYKIIHFENEKFYGEREISTNDYSITYYSDIIPIKNIEVARTEKISTSINLENFLKFELPIKIEYIENKIIYFNNKRNDPTSTSFSEEEMENLKIIQHYIEERELIYITKDYLYTMIQNINIKNPLVDENILPTWIHIMSLETKLEQKGDYTKLDVIFGAPKIYNIRILMNNKWYDLTDAFNYDKKTNNRYYDMFSEYASFYRKYPYRILNLLFDYNELSIKEDSIFIGNDKNRIKYFNLHYGDKIISAILFEKSLMRRILGNKISGIATQSLKVNDRLKLTQNITKDPKEIENLLKNKDNYFEKEDIYRLFYKNGYFKPIEFIDNTGKINYLPY